MKLKINAEIKSAGYEPLGSLDKFEDLININYAYFNKSIIILMKVPVEVKRKIDYFQLYKINSIPVMYKGNRFKINIDENDNFQAIGLKYRTSIDISKCIKKVNVYFCVPTSEFVDFKNDKGCISQILMNKKTVIDFCNIELTKNKEDVFIKVNGTYYYSIVEERKIEILYQKNI